MRWRLARAADRLRTEVRAAFPGVTVWTVGDADHRSRPSDHNPDDHDDDASTPGIVSAIDVVGRAAAYAVWNHVRTTRDPRVEYAIFDGMWTGEDLGWRVVPYGGSNKHRNHCHVSVGRGTDSNLTRPDLYDDPAPWGIADLDQPAEPDPTPEDDVQRSDLDQLPTLRNGDEGLDVKRLQGLLLAHGYGPEGLVLTRGPHKGLPDGDYGDRTEGYVTSFQKRHRAAHGKPDGIVGDRTWTLLAGGTP